MSPLVTSVSSSNHKIVSAQVLSNATFLARDSPGKGSTIRRSGNRFEKLFAKLDVSSLQPLAITRTSISLDCRFNSDSSEHSSRRSKDNLLFVHTTIESRKN